MEEKYTQLLFLLKDRFHTNMSRHKDTNWEVIENILVSNKIYLDIILKMEETGGEPDIIGNTNEDDTITIIDCSKESPRGRRSLCYDNEALFSRKSNKPDSSAIEVAKELGIEILDELQYKLLQKYECFDEKTSSWIKTPDSIRKLGGALFCDRRYNQVFTYHNGAESYYSARGFRGILEIKKAYKDKIK